MNLKRRSLCLFFLVLSVSAAYAGTYLETEQATLSGGKEPPLKGKTYVAADRMRIESGDAIIIVRLDKGLTWSLDGNRKMYLETTFQDQKTMADEAKRNMQDRLKNASPEQRKMMEQRMRSMGAGHLLDDKVAEIEVVKTSEKKTIDGRDCTKVIVKIPPVESAMWVCPELRLDKDAQSFYEKYRAVMKDFSMAPFKRVMTEKFHLLDGLPVEEIMKTPGQGGQTMQVKSRITAVKHENFSPSLFEIPEGFKKSELPPGGASPRR